jgi:4-amino-4-deoxy-L-arabinose transferase-like glycosyltransferase
MHYYDRWGRQLAAGDWLSRGIEVPMHPWHLEVARQHLAPRGVASPDPGMADNIDPGVASALWNRWLEIPRFYQDPLHPYLIGLTYAIAGPDWRYVFAWQLVGGILANVLIWVIARRMFDDITAAVAGAAAVLAGPLVYYELILLKESLIVCAGLVLVWLLDRTQQRRRVADAVVLGAALGTAHLLKTTFALFTVGAVAGLIWVHRRDRGVMTRTIGAALVGLAIAHVPLAARNLAVGASPLALGSTGPLTFAFSNQVDYPGDAGFVIDPPHLARMLGDNDARPAGVIADTLAEHTPLTFARLLWQKFQRAWHWFEIPNNENFYYTRLWIPVLEWLPVTFWLCAPWAWIGIAIAWRRLAATWPLVLLVGVSLAPLVLFYTLGRFRSALFAALLPFAAAGVVQCARWVRSGAVRPAVAASLAVIALGVWMGRPLTAVQREIRPIDWLLPLLVKYEQDVEAANAAGDYPAAADALLAFFRYEPSDAQIAATRTPELAQMFGHLHRQCAALLERSGRAAAAVDHHRRADRLLGGRGGQ